MPWNKAKRLPDNWRPGKTGKGRSGRRGRKVLKSAISRHGKVQASLALLIWLTESLVKRKQESVGQPPGFDSPRPTNFNGLKQMTMAKTTDRKKQEAQFKNKLRTMIGCVTHMQVVADQAMEMAGRFMTEDESDNSDALRVIENLSCVCEEALQVLYEELQKGTRYGELARKALQEL